MSSALMFADLKQLQWLEELERDRLRVTCLKVPERLLHDHFGRLLRCAQPGTP